MKITIRNKARLPNKILRLLKWKIYSVKRKFNDLLYAEVFIDSEGQSPKVYSIKTRLGIPGQDIIIRNQSKELPKMIRKTVSSYHRYLAENSNQKSNK
ncbi:MAG: hypothetical protein HKN53_04290 [Maribacter sp.]|nr:hypothetical protein [Maribacter sp.]